MDLDQWLAQIRRGTLELCVLRVLRRGDAHGYGIVQRLKTARVLSIREGTVYPVLQRMLRDRLLRAYQEDSPVGPVRRRFALTQKGRQALEQMEAHWRSFVEAVESLDEGEDGNGDDT
jgi:PadR family transcriptional regulator PadR